MSLLAHVRNDCSSKTTTTTTTTRSCHSRDVLRAIDDFCVSRHWMMHVGPEKGDILAGALRGAMLAKKAMAKARARAAVVPTAAASSSSSSSSTSYNVQFVAVELGTYCGYASMLMGATMREVMSSSDDGDGMDCRLFTAEINVEYAKIASEIIRLGRMEDLISVHEVGYDGRDTDVVSAVADAMSNDVPRCDVDTTAATTPTIDFLFIDHDKDAYTSDLCKLEASGMIRSGTRVVADNVIFANIDDYVGYVRRKEEMGIVKTTTIPCHVEYSSYNDESRGTVQNYQDGIEITDYLRDP
ncbi:hypothetical protein ACHAW5_006506 [Stephanodiscus triporus]|uniref:Catechol O-methyltransferase n=1 Tax=Stephanodiscus triporus TaxID=2934178 RepID=A0ABD3NIJ9_9STRA